MDDIDDDGRVISDAAACPRLRTYNEYNFRRPSYGCGFHRWSWTRNRRFLVWHLHRNRLFRRYYIVQPSFKLLGSNCYWLSSWSQCRCTCAHSLLTAYSGVNYIITVQLHITTLQCSELQHSEVHFTVQWCRVQGGAGKCGVDHCNRAVKWSGVNCTTPCIELHCSV